MPQSHQMSNHIKAEHSNPYQAPFDCTSQPGNRRMLVFPILHGLTILVLAAISHRLISLYTDMLEDADTSPEGVMRLFRPVESHLYTGILVLLGSASLVSATFRSRKAQIILLVSTTISACLHLSVTIYAFRLLYHYMTTWITDFQ